MKEKIKKIMEQAYDAGWDDCDMGNKYGTELAKYQQVVDKVLDGDRTTNKK